MDEKAVSIHFVKLVHGVLHVYTIYGKTFEGEDFHGYHYFYMINIGIRTWHDFMAQRYVIFCSLILSWIDLSLRCKMTISQQKYCLSGHIFICMEKCLDKA